MPAPVRLLLVLHNHQPVCNFDGVMEQAYQDSSPGDVVLLSPGCASFDMYDNYAQRGNDFKESVAMLKRKNPA